MKKLTFLVLSAALAMAGTAPSPAPVPLLSASKFGVFSTSSATNTGLTVVSADLGLSPGTSIAGFTPGSVLGTLHLNDAGANQGQMDALAAFNDAASRPATSKVTADLGGQTLTPGVYHSESWLALTGTLTLDGGGDPNAVFIFQVGSTLTTAGSSRVNLINGASACNVFWQASSSATLGAQSSFSGTILARTSIILTTGASLTGRALALGGSVTLNGNAITTSFCGSGGLALATTLALEPTPAPDLTISKGHSGNFRAGDNGDVYTITVSNVGKAPTSATVSMSDKLPSGLTATSISGAGWSCTLGSLSCTRSDVLAAGDSFPSITLTVSIDGNASGSITNTATVSGGGEVEASNNSASDTATIFQSTVAAPDLIINKTHAGAFQPGDTADTFTLTVTNIGSVPTTGGVTVSDTLPVRLTAVAMSGNGWSCAVLGLTCTRSDALAAGASYPSITLTVAVSASAAGSLTNWATVAGGGELDTRNDSASDTVTITPVTVVEAPDLILTKSHTGNFRQGDIAGAFALSVTNIGALPTTSAVTVNDALPAGLTARGIAGAGWSCVLVPLGCTRADTLGAGSSFPPIVVTVGVAANAPASVINTASVSGGGELNTSNDFASDIATVVAVAPPPPSDLIISKTHSGNFRQGDTGDTYTLTVTNIGLGPTAGTVTVNDTLPAGLTATAISGPGWTCATAPLGCARNDVLIAGGSYPPITLTVNVARTSAGITPAANASLFQPGDILLSMADGSVQWRHHDWALVRILAGGAAGEAKGMAFDSSQNLLVTHWTATNGSGNNVVRFDSGGNLVGLFGAGYDCSPSSVLFDKSGNAYVGQADCSSRIVEYDSSGNQISQYSVAVENRGSSYIVLDPNQCTMYYTSEGPNIKRFNICANAQMSNFNVAPLPGSAGHAFSLLSGGGMLIANYEVVARLDSAGNLVRTYNAPTTSSCWLGTALDPDGTSFWASNSCESSATRFDLATGAVIESHVADPAGFMVKQILVAPGTAAASNTIVTNTATVAGGGELNTSNNSASDATTITPPAATNPTGSFNAASYLPVVAAGSIATVLGEHLATGSAIATSDPLPATLAGSSFQVNGRSAPLFMVSPRQVNLQIPWEVSGQTQGMVTSTLNGIADFHQNVALSGFAPGIFTVSQTGTGQALIVIAGTADLAGPASTPGARPAARGDYLSIFATGLGAVSNQPETGASAKSDPLSVTTTLPVVTIGGVPALVTFSGLAPGFTGLYQVNVQVPDDAPAGDQVQVLINIGNTLSAASVTIAVR